jgi:hypothetical protein
MPMKVPNTVEVSIVTTILTPPLTLKLYSNDKTPADGDTVAAYTEVIGGNYASKPLVFATWTITAGAPTVGSYPAQTWIFNGPTGGPGSIYGYYVIRNSDGLLQWAERFPAANVPFAPVNGSKIIVLPRFSAESLF